MLRKLLKHEWKSTWKLPAGLCIFEIFMMLLGCMAFRSNMWMNLRYETPTNYPTVADILGLIALLTFFVALVGGSFALTIYFAVRFYKHLYTDEGYLTHTLPVTPRQLVISKLLISSLWTLVSSVVALVCTFALIGSMFRALGLNEELLREAGLLLTDLGPAFAKYSGVPIGLFIVIFAIIIIVGCISGNVIIYACISIGQLFKKHRVAAAIVSYLVVTSGISLVATVAYLTMIPIMSINFIKAGTVISQSPAEMVMMPFSMMMPFYYLSLATSLIFTIAGYIATEYIMKRKLNLE